MSAVGMFIVRNHYDDGTAVRHEVVQADRRIAISPELLAQAVAEDWPTVAIDGPFVGLLGHGYRATGEMHDNAPVFERCE